MRGSAGRLCVCVEWDFLPVRWPVLPEEHRIPAPLLPMGGCGACVFHLDEFVTILVGGFKDTA